MNLSEIMKKNSIELECLFTLAKLDDKEGLMYFKPVVENINDAEVTNLDPQCLIIDDGKFIYDEEMDSRIIINMVENIVTFTRIDGIQLNIDVSQIDFPFKTKEFKTTPITEKPSIPEDFVELES